jgi:hypothetical protein
LLALWLPYNGPNTTLSFEIMLDILLIVVIGGMGTLYGAVIGSVLFVLAQNYLQDLLKLAAGAVEGVPVLPGVLTPDRWLLWLGGVVCVVGLLLPDRGGGQVGGEGEGDSECAGLRAPSVQTPLAATRDPITPVPSRTCGFGRSHLPTIREPVPCRSGFAD